MEAKRFAPLTGASLMIGVVPDGVGGIKASPLNRLTSIRSRQKSQTHPRMQSGRPILLTYATRNWQFGTGVASSPRHFHAARTDAAAVRFVSIAADAARSRYAVVTVRVLVRGDGRAGVCVGKFGHRARLSTVQQSGIG